MKKFFEVKAKCGHVGRGYYYEGTFYEVAESKKQAAEIVRIRGRVKHHHKDAILSVREITAEEYAVGKQTKANEAYFNCKNIQEQNMYWDEIKDYVKPEVIDERETEEERRKKRKNRIQFKRAKYIQNYCNWDYMQEVYAV